MNLYSKLKIDPELLEHYNENFHGNKFWFQGPEFLKQKSFENF